ncbi:MAG: ABC transporter ATP-binding protein [Planctomycetaceae bacterium]|nr:ABC transporter ATP-binding protein [Planctomycetaceae bacterium]
MIKLCDVSLRYPIMGFVSHSFQRSIYNRVGGLLGRSSTMGHIEHVEALRGITLDVSDGERLGVLGHNGAGKTSLLRLIGGIYPPSSGTLETAGSIRSLTNYTLGMDSNASGRKNIIFRLVFMGYSFGEAEKAVDAIIEFSELGEFIDLPVRTYSSGMFVRLAFSVSTHFAPDILLLDEIIGAGDIAFQKKAQKRIKELFDQSRIIVLAAHDLNAIKNYCTRAVILSQGRIAAVGDPDDMVKVYQASFVQPNANTVV